MKKYTIASARSITSRISSKQMDQLCYWLERGGRQLDDWTTLIKLFPFEGNIFRGLGFNTGNEAQTFLRLTSAGTYTSQLASSWSTSSTVALQFAHTTWEGSKWTVPGYVIKTYSKGIALFEVCKCLQLLGKLPTHLQFLPNEFEVALPSGTYPIQLANKF